jgi:hypothetical protein
MPISPKAARRMLDQFEGLASVEEDGEYHRRFNGCWFSVVVDLGDADLAPEYRWSDKPVSKAIALDILRTYASGRDIR